ncbi:MAG: dihydroxy-acid dehydratase, partial [Pseudomonadota bacterium]|nr:dihydroxy-acid dehydratase [Pseudomonadota bacterium]
PELHKLTPSLSVLQKRGYHVALVTDGRMSGASGTVPAAIHVTPEAVDGGVIAKIKDGDLVSVDFENARLEVLVDENELNARDIVAPDLSEYQFGMGRELFGNFRANLSGAESGASVLFREDQ